MERSSLPVIESYLCNNPEELNGTMTRLLMGGCTLMASCPDLAPSDAARKMWNLYLELYAVFYGQME